MLYRLDTVRDLIPNLRPVSYDQDRSQLHPSKILHSGSPPEPLYPSLSVLAGSTRWRGTCSFVTCLACLDMWAVIT